ncbi:MAG TPA: LysR family transcriptional regulator [Pseudonocardia sp.]|jgi:DNA-binding transcriptional LysR family regulator|nr:LysR family transcriptional regulator [Pseudonocardia sp.]
MELRTLEYFVAVAEEGSFTKAAARCHIVQPAISQQIQGLERELGERLFERLPRCVALTTGGRALLPYARECLAVAAKASAEFAARAGLLSGELNLGTVAGMQETFLPAVMGAYHRRHPGVAVRLTDGTSAPLLRRVVAGQLDAAVIAAPPELPAGVDSRTVLEDTIVAVLAAGTDLAGRAKLTFEDISRHPVITYNTESGLWPLISGAFEARGVALNVHHACNDVPLQVALAAERVGVALSAGSDPALLGPSGVTVVPLRPAIRYRKILVWRGTPSISAPLRAFLEIEAERPG